MTHTTPCGSRSHNIQPAFGTGHQNVQYIGRAARPSSGSLLLCHWRAQYGDHSLGFLALEGVNSTNTVRYPVVRIHLKPLKNMAVRLELAS